MRVLFKKTEKEIQQAGLQVGEFILTHWKGTPFFTSRENFLKESDHEEFETSVKLDWPKTLKELEGNDFLDATQVILLILRSDAGVEVMDIETATPKDLYDYLDVATGFNENPVGLEN